MDFTPTDLSGQDPELQQEPSDVLRDLAEEGKYNLYLFNSAILGYRDMTVDVHGPLCTFVDVDRAQYKLMLMPRDHFKSTCVTIGGSLQKAVRNVEERIHIKNEREDNAERFLSAIQAHCLGNPRFRTLYGNLIPPDVRKVRWNKNEMDLHGRSGVYPEPTISCSGALTATTSNHYSHVLWDDPISDAAVDSEPVMEETWMRMKSSIDLLTKPETDTIWIVGTNWAHNDVYARWMKNFGKYTSRLARGAIENGKPIFPQHISLERLDMFRAADPYKFSCNYMNNPRDSGVQHFDVRCLKRWKFTDRYEDEIIVYDPLTGETLVVVDVDKLDITMTLDLAVSEKTSSDRNAICVQGIEPVKGYCIVLESWAERCPPSRVMDMLFHFRDKWNPRKTGIESVAYQKAFKYFLTDEATRRGVWFPVEDLKAQGKKEVRINGLQPMIRLGRCAVHVDHQLLISEMDDWPLGEHDDVLESWAMHLQIANHWFSPERLAKYKAAEQRMLKRAGLLREEDLDDSEAVIVAKVKALLGNPAINYSHTTLYN